MMTPPWVHGKWREPFEPHGNYRCQPNLPTTSPCCHHQCTGEKSTLNFTPSSGMSHRGGLSFLPATSRACPSLSGLSLVGPVIVGSCCSVAAFSVCRLLWTYMQPSLCLETAANSGKHCQNKKKLVPSH